MNHWTKQLLSLLMVAVLLLSTLPAAMAEAVPIGEPAAGTPALTEPELSFAPETAPDAGIEAEPASEAEPLIESTPPADPYAALTFTAVEGGLSVTACDPEAETAEIPAQYNGQPVIAIAANAFAGCKKLTGVTVAEGVLRIGSRAFAGLPLLASAALPASLTVIAEDAFAECPLLQTIEAPADSAAAAFAAAYAAAKSAASENLISIQSVPAVDTFISLNGINKNAKLYVGQSLKLTAQITTSRTDLDRSIVWTSSNPRALSVSSTGMLRANAIPTDDEGGNPVIITAELKNPPTSAPVRTQAVVSVVSRLTSLRSPELESHLVIDVNDTNNNHNFHIITEPEGAQALYTVKSSNFRTVSIYPHDIEGVYEVLLNGGTGTVYVTITSTDGSALTKSYPVVVYQPLRGVSLYGTSPDKLRVGNTFTPRLVYSPAQASIASVVWSGSNEFAAVDPKTGRVTPAATVTTTGKVTPVATVTDVGGNVRTCAVDPITIFPNTATVKEITGPLSIVAGKSVTYAVSYNEPSVKPTSANPLLWKLEASSDNGATYQPADPKTVGKAVGGRVTLVSNADSSLLLRVSAYTKLQGEADAKFVQDISVINPAVLPPLEVQIAGNCHNGADWDLSAYSDGYVHVTANAEVTWKVSGAAIAASQSPSATAISIDPSDSNGKTVTVSASAIDGSGRRVVKKFKVCTVPMGAVLLPNPVTMSIGKTYTPKVKFYPDTSSKSECAVRWSATYNGPEGTVDAVEAGYITLNPTTGAVKLRKSLNRYSVMLKGEYTRSNGSGYDTAAVQVSIDETEVPLKWLTVRSEGKRKYLNTNGPTTKTLQLTAAAIPADTSQIVDWSSSNEGIATVSDSGLVTAVSAGTVNITAKSHDSCQRTASIRLTVVAGPSALILNPGSANHINVIKNVLAQNAWDAVDAPLSTPIIWSRKKGEPNAEHPAILTINRYGQVTARSSGSSTGVGTATIVATSALDPTISTETHITVYDHPQITSFKLMQNGVEYTKDYIRLGKDDQSPFTFQITTSPVSRNVFTITSDPSVVRTVDYLGVYGLVRPTKVIIGSRPGTVTITGIMDEAPEVPVTKVLRIVRCVEQVSIISHPSRLRNGERFALTATVAPADATYPELVWTVDKPGIASIDKYGVLTAGAVQEPTLVTVTATSTESLDDDGQNGISSSFSFYVDP